VLKAVEKVFKTTGKRGVLVTDRVLILHYVQDWLDNKYSFVVRLVGKRHLLRFIRTDDKTRRSMDTNSLRVACRADTNIESLLEIVKHHGKIILRVSQFGWVKVRLPQRQEVLTMVVSRISGEDTPMMLLTNLPVKTQKMQTNTAILHPKMGMREGIRFLKSQVHLERIRTFRWRAIGRLVLLAVLVMIYIGWVIETHLDLAERLIRFGQRRPAGDFLSYRLLTGMMKHLSCFWFGGTCWRYTYEKSPKFELISLDLKSCNLVQS